MIGEVNLIPKGTFGKGQSNLLGIWSENILIDTENDSKYQLNLKLTEKLFIGNYYRYQFQFSKNQLLIVKSTQSEYKVGETYNVVFPESHLFELKED